MVSAKSTEYALISWSIDLIMKTAVAVIPTVDMLEG